MHPFEKLYTREDLHRQIKISVSSIKRFEALGLLKATRVGSRLVRYRHSDVEVFLERGKSGSSRETPIAAHTDVGKRISSYPDMVIQERHDGAVHIRKEESKTTDTNH